MRNCFIYVPLLATILSMATHSQAEQKILFNLESISYKSGMDDDISRQKCEKKCDAKNANESAKVLMESGWRVVSAYPKDMIGSEYFVDDTGRYAYGCTCKGTQYVLEKNENDTARSSSDIDSKLTIRENELLKKEIALLKFENEELKKKLKQKFKK